MIWEVGDGWTHLGERRQELSGWGDGEGDGVGGGKVLGMIEGMLRCFLISCFKCVQHGCVTFPI